MNTKYQQYAPLILRLVMGFGFIVHGWVKLSRGPAGFEKLIAQAGVPFPHFTSWLVPLTEVGGGLALMTGGFTTLVAIPLIMTMLVAMITVQLKFGFSSVNTIGLTPQGPKFGPPGYEINLLYIGGLISLIITGAGAFSVDGLLARQRVKKAHK
ncbi:DoxX family protein [Mucilaginibacter lappiensis]|uniref:Putative oxidoreductase n=1 Tax=Mucilaginibacter lappiensis TaxID=354630 RepID=A0A841JL11_9SPHI|nr:DoxX family protein [Mucilaginibacter lappiensis]MBB6131873.1 putative oxidoreductase [Mucilaginibacter lappiensis]